MATVTSSNKNVNVTNLLSKNGIALTGNKLASALNSIYQFDVKVQGNLSAKLKSGTETYSYTSVAGDYAAPTVLTSTSGVTPTFVFNGSSFTSGFNLGIRSNVPSLFSVVGGSGNDTIAGGLNADTLAGGAGSDFVSYESAFSAVNVTLSSIATTVSGGAGSDVISGFEGIIGSAFNDTLSGGSGADTILGNAGNDSISGGSGADSLSGGVGNDTLIGGAGNDTIAGDAGTDTVDYSAAKNSVGETLTKSNTGITVDLSASDGGMGAGGTDVGTDVITGVENVIGTGGNDTLTGSSKANVLTGGTGNDVISGGAGNDSLNGGSNDDSLVGGDGNDTFTDFSGADTIWGGAASDTVNGTGGSSDTLVLTATSTDLNVTLGSRLADNRLNFVEAITAAGAAAGVSINVSGQTEAFTITGSSNADTLAGGTGNDTIDGGAGVDTIDFGDYSGGVTISLNASSSVTVTGAAGNDIIKNIENVFGSTGDDSITGDANANLIAGGAGVDTIDGAVGTDTVDYSGAKKAVGGDLATTDAGITITLNGSTAVSVTAGDTNSGADSVVNVENVTGTDGKDNLTGDNKANLLSGGKGNDTISGDVGDDTLTGGAGADILTGGSGSDVFVFAGSGSDNGGDTITDFTVGSGNDVFNFAAFGLSSGSALDFDLDASGLQGYLATSTKGVALANKVGILLGTAIGDVDSAAEVAAFFGSSLAFNIATNSKGVVVATTAGQTQAYVYFVSNDGTSAVTASEVTLVGTVTLSANYAEGKVASGNFLL